VFVVLLANDDDLITAAHTHGCGYMHCEH